MTLQDWGALGELIGGVAIIVSLIYVGLQIRQSTHASRAATSQAHTSQFIGSVSLLVEPGFSDIFWRGLPGLHNLQAGEKVAFTSYISIVLRMFESFYMQEKDGNFDSRLFGGWGGTYFDLLANEGPHEVLEIWKHLFNAQFIEFLQDGLASADPKDMYSKVEK